MKIAVVANEIACDALDAGICQGIDERFECGVNVVVMEACVNSGIAAAEHNQVAFEKAGVGPGGGVKGSFDAKVRAQAVECQRNGIKLGV